MLWAELALNRSKSNRCMVFLNLGGYFTAQV
jgi:hypothetical protein